uniref:Uncharacterized protein n=1 Tax=Opuntia streptacantha TaxID=393608 RepID=A0A7C9D7A3_OPUST
MMSLCGHSTLGVLFPFRVFVPHRWKRRFVGMLRPSPSGILEFLPKLVFLRERHLKPRFLWRISLKEEILVVLVDALCVRRRKKLWIISLCIVVGFFRFGIYLSL